MDPLVLLVPLFFLTALAYATVGFGGGSTYLALLILCQIPYTTTPKVALLCNLLVVSGGLYHYIRARQLSVRRVLPFVMTSVPLAYVGGRLPVSREAFLLLVGTGLFVAGLHLLAMRASAPVSALISRAGTPQRAWPMGLPLGSALGLLAGITGLGGGIFLSPLLYHLGWGTPRQIAAASSLFIGVNSLAGLIGQWAKAPSALPWPWLAPLLIAVVLGGQIGSRLSVGTFAVRTAAAPPLLAPLRLQRITATLVLIVAIRIFWGLV